MSQNRYRVLLDTINLGVQENDCTGTITFSNQAHHRILGYGDGELLGKKIWDQQCRDEDKEGLKKYFTSLVQKQPPPKPFITQNVRKNGTLVDLQIDWNYTRDSQGDLEGFVSVISDITERKIVEGELLTLNHEYSSLIKTCQSLAETLDLQKVLQISVDSVTELVGLDTAAVYLLENDMLRLSATTPPLPADFPEEMRYAPLSGHPHIQKTLSSREPVLIFDYLKADLSPAELAIAINRNLRTLFFIPLLLDQQAMGVFIVGAIGKPSKLSEVSIELSRTLAGLSSLSLKNAKLYEESLSNALRHKRMLTERIQMIEEKNQLESQLLQAQKMEAIGKLAGGIAHDFNNILTALFGFTQIAQFNLNNPEKLDEALGGIHKATTRAQNLVKQILNFSRCGIQEKQHLSIADIVDDALQLVRQAIPETVEIRSEGDSRQKIFADQTQLLQVIMNLCTNGYQAMREHSGTITIRVHDERQSEPGHEKDVSISAGDYVVLSVSDDGIGMTPEIVEQIFKPFYTTKEIGEGTGLGLCVVNRIVSEHQGHVVVDSELGVGTTFRVYFPVSESSPEDPARHEEQPEYLGLRGSERILFVDDEQTLLNIAELAFTNLGYEISVFSDPAQALEHFVKDSSRYQVLVTDMTMPNMTGIELSRQAQLFNPELKTFLCSGFSDLIDAGSAKEQGVTELINKPYQFNTLIKSIRKSLIATGR